MERANLKKEFRDKTFAWPVSVPKPDLELPEPELPEPELPEPELPEPDSARVHELLGMILVILSQLV